MQRLCFIHISDLHLDNFSSVKKEENSLAVRLHEAPYEALQNLLELCERCNPQFIVFTGDLYQHGLLSLKARTYLTKFFNALAENKIPFYYVKGNHDHIGQNDSFFTQFPYVFVYQDAWSYFTYPPNAIQGEKCIRLYGYSHNTRKENQNVLQNLHDVFANSHTEEFENVLFSIGLFHATVKQKNSSLEKVKNTDKHVMALCYDEELKEFPINYWALGHIHEHSVLSEQPYIAYAGAMQATRMGETGERGAVVVTIDNIEDKEQRQIHTEFCPLSPLESYDIVLSLGEDEAYMNLEEVRTFLIQSFQNALLGLTQNPYCVDEVIRVVIDGQHSLFQKISAENFLVELGESLTNTEGYPRVHVKKVFSWLRPCFDFVTAYKREDILGEVFRVLDTLKQDSCLFEEILTKLESEFKIKKEYELGFFQNSEMRSEKQIRRYKESLFRACENIIVNILEPK